MNAHMNNVIIRNTAFPPVVLFKDLLVGEVFTFKEKTCMKIEEGKYINLATGLIYYPADDWGTFNVLKVGESVTIRITQ